MNLSQIRSADNKISFLIDISKNDQIIPQVNRNIEPFMNASNKAVSSIIKLLSIIGNAAGIDNYRQERASALKEVNSSLVDLREHIKETIDRLGVNISPNYLNEEFGMIQSSIDELEKLKNEIDLLNTAKARTKGLCQNLLGIFNKKVRYLKAVSVITKGEIGATLDLRDDGGYDLIVTTLPSKLSNEEAVVIAQWKEFMAIDIRRKVDSLVQELNSKKEILKNLMKDRFNPWVDFEERLKVGEFLKYRAEIVNFWNNEFSFTEGLPYHFFKAQKFYTFFESSLLKKLNEVKEKIEIQDRLYKVKFELQESPSLLYQNISVAEFLLGKTLRIAPTSLRNVHFNFETIEKKQKNLASKIWKSTLQEIAQKLGGVVVGDNLISRENTHPNNKVLKTQLIVVTKESDDRDGKVILNGQYRDLISQKTENYTELVILKGEDQEETIEVNTRLEYFLSSSKMAA